MKLLLPTRLAAVTTALLLSAGACSGAPGYAIEDLKVSLSGQIVVYEIGQIPKTVALEKCATLNRFTPESDTEYYHNYGGFHPYNFRLDCDDILIDLLYRPEEREGVDKGSFIRGRMGIKNQNVEQGCKNGFFLVGSKEFIITEKSTNLAESGNYITSKLPWSVNIKSIYNAVDDDRKYITCAEMDIIFKVEEV